MTSIIDMKAKEIYNRPEIEIIELETSGSIMSTSPGGGNIGGNGNANGNTSAYSKRRFGWEED